MRSEPIKRINTNELESLSNAIGVIIAPRDDRATPHHPTPVPSPPQGPALSKRPPPQAVENRLASSPSKARPDPLITPQIQIVRRNKIGRGHRCQFYGCRMLAKMPMRTWQRNGGKGMRSEPIKRINTNEVESLSNAIAVIIAPRDDRATPHHPHPSIHPPKDRRFPSALNPKRLKIAYPPAIQKHDLIRTMTPQIQITCCYKFRRSRRCQFDGCSILSQSGFNIARLNPNHSQPHPLRHLSPFHRPQHQ